MRCQGADGVILPRQLAVSGCVVILRPQDVVSSRGVKVRRHLAAQNVVSSRDLRVRSGLRSVRPFCPWRLPNRSRRSA